MEMVEIASLVSADYLVLLMPMMSFMLYDFMQDGMIFSRYGKWLNTLPSWLAKPMGLCLKCFHIWVCILFFIFFGESLQTFILLTPTSYLILLKLYY